MIYLYIFLVIAILIFFYLNRSQIIYEDFSNKKKTKKIKKIIKKIRLPQQTKILPQQAQQKILPSQTQQTQQKILPSQTQILPSQTQILPPQNIVLDESRNKEYTNAEEVNTNNYYKLLMKDKVETKIRSTSEKKECISHIKPETKEVINQYGYSYLPPEVWSVPQDRPPVCIPQVGFKAEALPMYTVGTPIDALEISNTILPKFTYNEVYDPKYYYPGYQSK
jgi:hypothetical protein